MKRSNLFPLTAALAVTPLTPTVAGAAGTPVAAPAPVERRVATPAGELQVRTAGRGRTPLLLWHALYADPSMFDGLVEELAPDHRLLLVTA
ncbi:MAG: alpha/beta fold hydrolase, partial [Pseudomonadota bacterium]